MTIALAPAQVKPHWLQCESCEGWYNPHKESGATITEHYAEKTVCRNCAEEAGLMLCDGCDCFFENMVHCDGSHYCDDCIDSANILFCNDCEEWHSEEDIVDCNGTHRCEICANEASWYECEGCKTWEHLDDQHICSGGDHFCADCFYENYFYCGDCGEVSSNDDAVARDGDMYCSGCAPNEGDFDPTSFRNHSGCVTKMGSKRCFGLELETNECDDYWDLEGNGAWGAKDDPTVRGKEFYSTILDGDEGLDVISELTEFADRNSWTICSSCGFHLHLDMRGESDDSLKAAAYAYRATQAVWFKFVDENRPRGNYSYGARWNCSDLAQFNGSFYQFVGDEVSSRYEWVNLQAYSRHYTFEIRLHQGTLDEEEICNWVKAHARFVDWATGLGFQGVIDAIGCKTIDELFNLIVNEAWKDDELRDYYEFKAGF